MGIFDRHAPGRVDRAGCRLRTVTAAPPARRQRIRQPDRRRSVSSSSTARRYGSGAGLPLATSPAATMTRTQVADAGAGEYLLDLLAQGARGDRERHLRRPRPNLVDHAGYRRRVVGNQVVVETRLVGEHCPARFRRHREIPVAQQLCEQGGVVVAEVPVEVLVAREREVPAARARAEAQPGAAARCRR